jgi:hypothetical protein
MPNQMPQQGMGGPANLMQQMMFNKLYNTNPNFRMLADHVRNKTPEQAFQEVGLDYNQFKNVDPRQIMNTFGF